LGKNFKYLLGNSHCFDGFSADLVKRYVCLGDDDIDAEGRFADLTKSADLYIDDPRYPLPMVIRDTPGVNDPFLVRETVTLDNLAQSDICVIVLSAHQSFTSVDIALIRILLALKHDQIVLFVNRIDELHDPAPQIAEIDAYIRETLVDQGLPHDLPIIFGSALWANATIAGSGPETLGPSTQRLHLLIKDRLAKGGSSTPALGSAQSNLTKTSDLSGLGELQRVIDEKAAQAVGAPFVDALRMQALALCQQSAVLMRQSLNETSPIRADLDVTAINQTMAKMVRQIDQDYARLARDCAEHILFDISAAYREFIFAETRALNTVLDNDGKITDWTPDTDKLRRALNKAYRHFSENGHVSVQAIFDKAAQDIADLYGAILRDQNQLFAVKPPAAKPARMPTSLMQSMTIDVTTGWLDAWFTRKVNKSAFAKRLSAIVADEMKQTIKDMQEIYIVDFVETAQRQLADFIDGHFTTLHNLAALDDDTHRAAQRRKFGLDSEISKRLIALAQIETTLSQGDQAQGRA
jgi:hypothetical protein